MLIATHGTLLWWWHIRELLISTLLLILRIVTLLWRRGHMSTMLIRLGKVTTTCYKKEKHGEKNKMWGVVEIVEWQIMVEMAEMMLRIIVIQES